MNTIKGISKVEVGTYTNETLLWRAVIARTIQESISGSLRRQREAEQYLFGDNRDFPLVCGCAGMDLGRLRSRLTRLRGHAIPSYVLGAAAQILTDQQTRGNCALPNAGAQSSTCMHV